MQIYPAIDVKGGRVARVVEGEERRETFYGDDPVAQARDFVQRGVSWLHVVDMDRAFRTGGDNSAIVQRITRLEGVAVQLGGNLDSLARVRGAAEVGAARLVLGTVVAFTPGLLRALVDEVGCQRVALAIDTREGRATLRGESDFRDRSVPDLVELALDNGIRTIVYRDIERDGTAKGADVERASRLVPLGANVILAGGVAGLDEIRAARDAGLRGLIVGRALYEAKFTLEQALECSS